MSRQVPFLQYHVGGLLARWPRLGPWLARQESRLLQGELPPAPPPRPVWVCGMARAGSTMLLELLYACGEFATQRYADYPLVWLPYAWDRLHRRLPLPAAAPAQRAHADRITVTPHSPEAFEEIFWMHFFPRRHDPDTDQVLGGDVDNAAFQDFFADYQHKLLAAQERPRYLAKANYQLARLGYLQRLYPQARFIIPVRDPLDQVGSLVKQDRLFRQLAAQDPRVAVHLARVGHYEFGPHKRAFNLGDTALAQEIGDCFARGDTARGYALQWRAQYGQARQCMAADAALRVACLWVDYGALCGDPRRLLQRIAAHLDLGAAAAQALVAQATRLQAPGGGHGLSAAEVGVVEEITLPLWHGLRAAELQGD
jgi:Sulfotransferase family